MTTDISGSIEADTTEPFPRLWLEKQVDKVREQVKATVALKTYLPANSRVYGVWHFKPEDQTQNDDLARPWGVSLFTILQLPNAAQKVDLHYITADVATVFEYSYIPGAIYKQGLMELPDGIDAEDIIERYLSQLLHGASGFIKLEWV